MCYILCLEEVPVAVPKTNNMCKYTHQYVLFLKPGHIGSIPVHTEAIVLLDNF
jgi:hypothetical protein